ncbi:1,6-anhydro-N-acetylmuramyl-L-alanine amidase AmpD [Candidatus Woesearchaeota archaeon]|nr:1,6-anhydro-N-acetylmuramyl-L-alanine amidase AmpD [Candidatus Woesearchaeota archaeon]
MTPPPPAIRGGWLTTATRCETTHQDERPAVDDISLIVIHCISLPPGSFGEAWIDRLFLGELPRAAHPCFESLHTLKVSAHLLIRRDGQVTQYVPFHARAWHAGVSRYQGRERCNDFSIGIELEGTETIPYETVQYRVLADIIGHLMQHYPRLTLDRITGHSDIAPERKTDPGPAFDRAYLLDLLNGQATSCQP